MHKVKVTTTTEIEVDLALLAEAFCGLDDDGQAQFFVEVAKRFNAWGPGKADQQCWYIGGHLRNCECSTSEARDLIESIHGGMQRSLHGVKAVGSTGSSDA